MLPERITENKPEKQESKPHLPERLVKKIGQDVLAQIEEQSEYDKGQLNTLVQFCRGKQKCPYGPECPVKTPPAGERCPLELYYQEKWFDEYVSSYNVLPSDKKMQAFIVSLVQIEIQLMRQQSIIQSEGFEQVIVTETEDGRKKYDKKLHNVLTLINQLEDRKTKIMKQLDSLQQTKATQNIIGDLAQALSQQQK